MIQGSASTLFAPIFCSGVKNKRMIILCAVLISLWPMLGKENQSIKTSTITNAQLVPTFLVQIWLIYNARKMYV